MTHQRLDSRTSRKLWLFVALAFGISWGAFAVRRGGNWDPRVDETLRLIVKFGPSLAGLAVAWVFGGLTGLLGLVRRLRIPFSRPGWVLLALLLPLAIALAALLVRSVVGSSIRPLSLLPVTEAVLLFGGLLATRFFLGGGLGEELGWRGVMLPALQGRMGAVNASFAIGIVHALWHLPAYGIGVIFLALFTVSGSFLFTLLYNKAGGNIFLPALLHAAGNASLPFVEAFVPAIDGEIAFPVLVFVTWGVAAFLLVTWFGLTASPAEVETTST